MRPPRRIGELRFPAESGFPSETVDSVIALYLTWRKWIHRRTDRLKFLDLTTVARETWWEMEFPDGLPTLPESDMFLVPIGLFKRDMPLLNVRSVDESDREVPLLTSRENRTLSEAMLTRTAEIEPGDRPSESWEALCRLQEQWGRLTEIGAGDLLEGLSAELDYLTPNAIATRCLMVDLLFGYLQIGVLRAPTERRRSLRITYEEQLRRLPQAADAKRGYSTESRLGIIGDRYLGTALSRNTQPLRSESGSRMHVVWPMWSAGDSEREHLEIEAPEPLEIEDAFSSWYSPTEDGWRTDCSADLGARGHLSLSREQQIWSDGSATQQSQTPPTIMESDRGAPVFVSVILRPRSQELERSARVLGILAFLLLVAVSLALLLAGPIDRATAATVVAFTASFATALLVRPHAHEMEGELLRGLRGKLAVIGAFPVFGALSLALNSSDTAAAGVLMALASGPAVLAFTRRAPRELKPKRDKDPRQLREEI